MIDTFSHELNEAITDPLKQRAGMTTRATSRATCAASTARRSDRPTRLTQVHTEYNQVINGGKYYTQAEFSNVAFGKLG